MKKNNNENKICFILHAISSGLFAFSGIVNIVTSGLSNWMGLSYIALSVTFGSLSYIYYKKYKEEK